jgi:putative tributyrin esterase
MAFLQCDFFSDVLGLSCSMNVILPQNTKKQIGMEGKAEEDKFPVLYLLHGLSDDHTIWMRRTSIERYVAFLGIAVVMPAVNKSFYVDMAQGDKYGEFISEELPEIAHSFFPLSDRREDTFVAGLSMGGYGAFLLALSNPAKFAAAASLSGAINIAGISNRTDVARKDFYERVFGPLDKLAGSDLDLFHLSAKLAESGEVLPRLFQCCGTEDFLYDDNLKFKGHMDKLPFDYHYEEGPGAHEWGYWDTHIQKVLKWMLKD